MPLTLVERVINLSDSPVHLKNQENPAHSYTIPGGTIHRFDQPTWIPWAKSGKRLEITARVTDQVEPRTRYLWQDHGADGDHVRIGSKDSTEPPTERNQINGDSKVRNDRDPITLLVRAGGSVEGRYDPFERWMEDLASKIGQRPLRRVVMPGTHDSGTYSIPHDGESGFAPDLIADPNWAGVASYFGQKYVLPVFAKWSRVQNKDITEQLCGGVRYFDLRVAWDGERFRIVHGLWGGSVDAVVEAVDRFLTEHPREVVLLDFNHFYSADDGCRKALATSLQQRFGSRMVPRGSGASVKMRDLWAAKQQVVVMMDSQAAVDAYPAIWKSGDSFARGTYSDNLDCVDKEGLRRFLDNEFAAMSKGTDQTLRKIGGTYMTKQALGKLYLSLYTVAEETVPILLEWLGEQDPNADAFNVINTDFFELGGQVDKIVDMNLRRDR
jgi:hypothetical protein